MFSADPSIIKGERINVNRSSSPKLSPSLSLVLLKAKRHCSNSAATFSSLSLSEIEIAD